MCVCVCVCVFSQQNFRNAMKIKNKLWAEAITQEINDAYNE